MKLSSRYTSIFQIINSIINAIFSGAILCFCLLTPTAIHGASFQGIGTSLGSTISFAGGTFFRSDPLSDTDGDGIPDHLDNCTEAANADQLDTDGDGYGNLCDGDLNNDGSTNTVDLNLYKQAHRTSLGDANYNPDADFNGDGAINTLDLNIYKGLHRKPPGPSCCGAL